jgi:hypothetical protein
MTRRSTSPKAEELRAQDGDSRAGGNADRDVPDELATAGPVAEHAASPAPQDRQAFLGTLAARVARTSPAILEELNERRLAVAPEIRDESDAEFVRYMRSLTTQDTADD